MALMGVRWLVSFFKPYYRISDRGSYVDQLERFVRVEKARVESVGIKTYLAIGISPNASLRDPFSLVEILEDYLKHDFVVAIGESGFNDYNDPLEIETLKVQMELARKFNKPIFVDLPDENKKYAFRRVEKLVADVDIDPSLVVLNNLTPLFMLDVSDSGFWMCASLYPERGFTDTLPEKILSGDFPIDRTLLTSNQDTFTLRPTVLPEVLYTLELKGHFPPIMEKVMFENPVRLFKLEVKP